MEKTVYTYGVFYTREAEYLIEEECWHSCSLFDKAREEEPLLSLTDLDYIVATCVDMMKAEQLLGIDSRVSITAVHMRQPLDQDVERGEFVCWLVNVSATCRCISGTDLLRQLYVLPH